MSVLDILEDKFENDLIDFLNDFQERNDCKIDFWSWNHVDGCNYSLKVKISKQDQKLIN